MDETESCPYNDPLLQGDILKFDNQTAQYPFNLAVVINADCDIENGKHDGVLALLPIFSFSEYLTKFWLPQFFDSQIKSATQQVRTLCSLNEVNIDELKRWIMAPNFDPPFDSKKFISRFELPNKQAQQLDDALGRLTSALTGQTCMSLKSLNEFAPEEKGENQGKFIRDQVTAAFKGLGEGHFFISEMKGDEDIGFVVRMRRIYSIEAGSCFNSYSDYLVKHKSQSGGAYRLCRLSPHYKFKLAQLFALQFSRIGLPNELMSLSGLAIENVTNKIRSEQ